MKVLLSLLLLVGISISHAQGQDNCTEKLHQARLLYQKGQLNESLELVNQCTSDTVSVADRWKAYRLLTITYLDLDNRKEARANAEKLLALQPTYKPNEETDPASFVRLINSITVLPKFGIGMAATVGGISTIPRIVNTYNAASYNKNYTSKNSWKVGIMGSYTMNKMISLHGGLIVASKKFNIDYQSNNTNFEFKENLTYLDIPIFARFYTKSTPTNTRLYADLGIYWGYLVNAKTDYLRVNQESGLRFENAGVSSINRRNRYEYGSIYGVGVSQKIKKLTINLDFKYYAAGFNNVTNEDVRFKQDQLFYGYYYLDDDIRLNNMALSLSFIHNINYRVIKEK